MSYDDIRPGWHVVSTKKARILRYPPQHAIYTFEHWHEAATLRDMLRAEGLRTEVYSSRGRPQPKPPKEAS